MVSLYIVLCYVAYKVPVVNGTLGHMSFLTFMFKRQ